VRLVFTLALLSGWHTKLVDFVLTYHQAPIDFDKCVNFRKGIQMARVWNKHLTSGLLKVGFVHPKVD
jgi:hypothetical protein